MSRRALSTRLRILWRTVLQTNATFRSQGLSVLRPVFMLLLLLTLLLLVINTVAPLAPFVYSLF